MKYLAWLIGILVTLVIIVYVVAFTSFGNGVLKPIIEQKITEQTKLESKFSVFRLSMSDFEIVLEIKDKNIIKAKGDYALFSQTFNIFYDVNLQNLQTLKPLTNSELRGAFYTNGNVKGDIDFMKIVGKSSVGGSDTSYNVELKELNPTSIIANIKDAKLAALLYMGAQNPYATADIDMDINFRDITPHKMDGEIILKTKNGKIDPKYMLSDFNVTIPQTSFSMDLDANLRGDDVNYKYELLSNLFKINSSGKVVPDPLQAELKYSLNIEDLEVLKPITDADVRGEFRVNGSVKGTKEKMVIDGVSDLASSDTTFQAILKEFVPSSVKAKVVNLDIAKLLYMVKQPHYTDGLFSMQADISDARSKSLSGKIVTTLTNGIFNSKYLSKTYEFSSLMPKTTFNAITTTVLSGNIADTKVDFNSNIANIDIKSAKFNIKDASLKSDYRVVIPNLDNLFFITNQHMRGQLIANGDISKAEDLDFTTYSNVADGKVEAKLHNDDFYANLSSLKTTKLLHMLIYPEIVDAAIDAKVKYNLAKSKGVANAKISDAVFAKNQMFDLLKQYTKFDMYRENFNGDIEAKIDEEDILASVDLRSKEASIKTDSTKLNTKTKHIDTDITLSAKKNVISAKLKGEISAPSVTIDLEKLMKSEAGKVIEEKVDEVIKKEVNKLFKKFF